MALRSIWPGSLSFALVRVPVRLTTATESKELRFHFLHKADLASIGYGKRTARARKRPRATKAS